MIPRLKDLTDIANTLHDGMPDFDFSQFTIMIEVDEIALRRLNEDFYYRLNDTKDNTPVEDVDEITVNVDEINFKYIKHKP